MIYLLTLFISIFILFYSKLLLLQKNSKIKSFPVPRSRPSLRQSLPLDHINKIIMQFQTPELSPNTLLVNNLKPIISCPSGKFLIGEQNNLDSFGDIGVEADE